MMKKLIFLSFAMILLSVPVYLMMTSEDVLDNGNRHKLRLQAYDPFDPFRGKYLRLNYDNTVVCDEDLSEGDAVFITLEKDSLGFSNFANGSRSKPENSTDYFESIVLNKWDGALQFKLDNLTKYFINEDKASPAEELIWDYQRNKPDSIYIAIRILDGEVRLEDIYIEETPLLEFLDQ